MKARLYAVVLALAMAIWAPFCAAQSTPIKALVLYDAPTAGDNQKLPFMYAIMLRNLLGHWNTEVDLQPVEQYASGQVEQYDATFYIGGIYDNQLPQGFLGDVYYTQKTVVWFKYNLWQIAWDPNFDFSGRYGFGFSGLRGMNATPSTANPDPGFFDTVEYNGKSLVKFYDFSDGVIRADPDVGVTSLFDPVKANQVASVRNPQTSEEVPYIVRAGNFWYIADLPFSYIGPRDRYLVICDLLHDMLGVQTPTSRLALVRLDDVSAVTTQQTMHALTDYLQSQNIPFGVATIPVFRDPGGLYYASVPSHELRLTDDSRLKGILDYAVQRGGRIVMHGYTHQYDPKPNPWQRVSGQDYEFWDIVENMPVLEDSEEWAGARIDAGLLEFTQNGYTPIAWESPNYQMSPNSISALKQRFDTTYERVTYYTSDEPDLNSSSPSRDYAASQFFPYIIKQDYYGQRVLPENLGNIQYAAWSADESAHTWQDVVLNAEMALVVRDGYASFYYQPLWLRTVVPGTQQETVDAERFEDFKNAIEGVTALGYTWIDPASIVHPPP